MVDPIPGDHIRVKVNGYYHHGIYIGNEEVVHLDFIVGRTDSSVDIIVVLLGLGVGHRQIYPPVVRSKFVFRNRSFCCPCNGHKGKNRIPGTNTPGI